MNAAQIADQAIAKMEAEENGTVIDDDKNKGKQDDKKPDDKSADDKGDKKGGDDSKSDTDDKKTPPEGKPGESDKDADKDKSDKKDDDKKPEGKYTADDALETDDKTPEPSAAPTDSAGVALSGDEQKYIVENIGEPIIIKGYRGTGDNIKEVEIKAYHAGDIPADFKFANDAQMIAAQNGFSALERRADGLLGQYRQQASTKQAQDFEKRENEGIRGDLADLQKEGLFPKFTSRPGEAGFDDTPEAKQMAEVLNLMTERNENYLKQYQQGRPYRHIGFREAFELWSAKNPGKKAEQDTNDKQDEEDKERGKVADKVGTGRGLTSPGGRVVKPTVRSGVTVDQILAAHDADFDN